MNFQMLNLLYKAIKQDTEYNKAILTKEGVLTLKNRLLRISST